MPEEVPPKPEFQAGAPVYEAYPQAMLGLARVNTLQQRVGNRSWGESASGSDARQVGVWGRVEGSYDHLDSHKSTTDTNYDSTAYRAQFGLDAVVQDGASGRLVGGVYAQYVHGNTITRSVDYADGKIETDGYGGGASLTWYGNNGWYVDGRAQATWFKSDLTTRNAGVPQMAHNNKGHGYVGSIEVGRAMPVWTNWNIIPQGQLSYADVGFDRFTDPFDAEVSLDRAHRIQGRLGVALEQKSEWTNAGRGTDRSSFYGIVNVYHDFAKGSRVDVSGTPLGNQRPSTWAGIGMGGTLSWNDGRFSLFYEGSANTSLSGFGDSVALQGNVGMRARF